jgi:predicted membrane protein
MKIVLQIGLVIVALVLAYFIYDGVNQKIVFKEKAAQRREVVQNRLLKIVDAQKQFKQEKGRYAGNFAELEHFLKHDSLTIIKAIGNVPDTLTEQQAVEQGIVIRDTSKVPASTVFEEDVNVDSLKIVPFSGGKQFNMKSGVIEKNKVNVSVFEASTKLENVYRGLKTRNEAVDLDDELKVGSMTEPITSGNW